jgi:hypothetical protein
MKQIAMTKTEIQMTRDSIWGYMQHLNTLLNNEKSREKQLEIGQILIGCELFYERLFVIIETWE